MSISICKCIAKGPARHNILSPKSPQPQILVNLKFCRHLCFTTALLKRVQALVQSHPRWHKNSIHEPEVLFQNIVIHSSIPCCLPLHVQMRGGCMCAFWQAQGSHQPRRNDLDFGIQGIVHGTNRCLWKSRVHCQVPAYALTPQQGTSGLLTLFWQVVLFLGFQAA